MFDKDDFYKVSGYTWYVDAKGYIVSKNIGKLHRLLMGAETRSLQIDHINRNKKDCRKKNMRFALNRENCANSATYKSNKSTGRKNIYAVGDTYRVIVRKDGKSRHFGYYRNINEAVKVANAARKKLFGEFAFIDKK